MRRETSGLKDTQKFILKFLLDVLRKSPTSIRRSKMGSIE